MDIFQIGEVAKFCGVDRQTILFYERKGLLKPTIQNSNSGYRYYSTEAVSELMQIIQLKSAGLSLREIKNYCDSGKDATPDIILHLEEKLRALQSGLDQLRAMSASKGDYSVTETCLPADHCYGLTYVCKGVDDAVGKVYESFREVLLKGIEIDKTACTYAEYPSEIGDEVNLEEFPMRVCVPISCKICGPHCIDTPSMPAITVSHRGDYSEIGLAYNALWEYVKAHKLVAAGAVREYYLDSRQEYKNNTDRYVTRLALPVEQL